MRTGKLILIILALGFISLVACSAGKIERPDWFWNPGMDGRTGGIGVSGPHVKGVNAQRRLAISRAINEIARQKGIEVKNVLKVTREGNRDKENTTQHSYSIQTVDGKSVTAMINDIWENPETNEIYVWMVVK